MYQPTELCLLGEKYGADKCPQLAHALTPYYYEMLKDRKYSVKKVLEMGVGNYRQISKWKGAQIGASLKMWRDFFPNAWVYGADWQPESIIEEERLSTYYANLDFEEDILKILEKTGLDLDLIIDDASHRPRQQLLLAKTILPRLTTKDWIYIIEDCDGNKDIQSKLPEYNAIVPQFPSRHDLNSEWENLPHCRDSILVIRPK